MNIKRYIGRTNHEAMLKLKKELGEDAVILHTRKIKTKGLLGLFKKPLVEVVAAREENISPNNNKSNFNYKPTKKRNTNEIDNLNKEITKLRKTIEAHIIPTTIQDDGNLDENLMYLKNILINNGVIEEYALSIIKELKSSFNITNKNEEDLINILKQLINSTLGEANPIEIDNNKKVVFFVGTTGVGKTTTLAKIAADLSLNKDKELGLITADTYRIAAVEQLKTYSEILNLPLEIIYNTEEIYMPMSKFKDKDIILVDTAGRSHKDHEKISELESMIDIINNKEVYLVLSINTEFSSIKSIIDNYSKIPELKLIFTKLDETEKIGNILNAKLYSKYPISYITNGQNVPEDLQVFSNEIITDMIVGEN
ncbi:flagellar biosynthesis protein FlhF [Clostridium sp. D2Q-11]|uniref:Flagellar biosynthesis protein FlhF n=1 Tax=Anaeromonas frigoriresistens TaxID=2683708 RepID=A0A942UV92_9FIRM|nr:flagellar biosynthesis protein FlhF [Anaeromonas frigoriresistens]MBS4539864.1 flagellar biosynthesis protein FlhF [Anaeromonas frigoriresistens]